MAITDYIPFRRPRLNPTETPPTDTSVFSEVPSYDEYLASPEAESKDAKDDTPEINFWYPRTLVERHGSHYYSRASVAFVTDKDSVTFAVAFCSPFDQFSRRIGKELALQRLTSKDQALRIPTRRHLTNAEARRLIAFVIDIGNLVDIPGYPSNHTIEVLA